MSATTSIELLSALERVAAAAVPVNSCPQIGAAVPRVMREELEAALAEVGRLRVREFPEGGER